MKEDIQKFISFLNQPYLTKDNRKFILLVSTALVLFVLAALQPFGISQTKGLDYILILFVSGIGTLLGSSITLYLLPLFFKTYYKEWTIGKEILNMIFTVLCIGILNGLTAVLFNWIYFHRSSEYFIQIFIYLFIATLLVSPIPVIVLFILRRNQALSLNLLEAQDINQRLIAKSPERQGEIKHPITLTGTTKDSIELILDELLYLEAFGNYVKVHYRQNNKTKQKLLRTTIKQMEDQLVEYSSIVKCHRAFLVNLDSIQHVKGNSQGYRLVFDGTEEEVLVSRAYTKALKERMEEASLI